MTDHTCLCSDKWPTWPVQHPYFVLWIGDWNRGWQEGGGGGGIVQGAQEWGQEEERNPGGSKNVKGGGVV